MKMKHVYSDDLRWTEDADKLAEKFTSILNNAIDDALKEFRPESVYYIIDDVVRTRILEYIFFNRDIKDINNIGKKIIGCNNEKVEIEVADKTSLSSEKR